MRRPVQALLVIGLVGLGLTGGLLEERRAPAPQAPEPTQTTAETARRPRVRFRVPKPDIPEWDEPREPFPSQKPPPFRSDPAFAAADLYVLREYVDMSGRFASISVRIFGELRLDRKSGRVEVLLRTDPLLRGNEVFGSSLHRAEGTWRLEGDELVVEGLELANGRKDVFEPRGGTKRWRIERADGAVLIHGGPLTFERRDAP